MLFGLFSPKPPLTVREKAWAEVRMRWLARQFGIDRLLKAEMVLPDDHWFPDQYEGTTDDARRLLDRIGGFMQLNTLTIQLEICEDEAMPGAAGQHQPGLIRLAESQLADPPGLVAVLAHELAHELLSSRGLLPDAFDAEWVTDLLPVYLGLGIFTANATLSEETMRQGRHSRWTIRRRGYLSSCMIGYALALFAWVRGERRPAWAEFLRRDAADTLAAGLRYLHASEDSLFTPETCRYADRPTSWYSLLEQIEVGSPSACVAGLWELADHPRDSRDDLGQAVHLVGRHLTHHLPAVRAEAARALAALGPAAEPVLDDLLRLLDDTDEDVAAAAAYSLGRLGMQPGTVVPHLVLTMDERHLICPAAVAIAAYGESARSAVPKLGATLLWALTTTQYGIVDCLVHAIEATAADSAAELRQVLADCDAEQRPQAEHMLAECDPVGTGAWAPGAWFGEGCQ
jgi:HEAT repeat protein